MMGEEMTQPLTPDPDGRMQALFDEHVRLRRQYDPLVIDMERGILVGPDCVHGQHLLCASLGQYLGPPWLEKPFPCSCRCHEDGHSRNIPSDKIALRSMWAQVTEGEEG